jgi:hypothetical protein
MPESPRRLRLLAEWASLSAVLDKNQTNPLGHGAWSVSVGSAGRNDDAVAGSIEDCRRLRELHFQLPFEHIADMPGLAPMRMIELASKFQKPKLKRFDSVDFGADAGSRAFSRQVIERDALHSHLLRGPLHWHAVIVVRAAHWR